MKMHTKTTLAVLALVAGLALLAGCESDSVAPNDDLPELTREDAAIQSGAVAVTLFTASLMAIEDPGVPTKAPQRYVVDDAGFSGSVWLDFLSEEGGTDATWNTAGWVRLYTTDDPVTYTTPLGGTTVFDLDYSADITRDPTNAVVNGSGTMTSGDYTLSYEITDLEVEEGADYPLGGDVMVTTQGHTVEMSFSGGVNALLVVDGTERWNVNLDTGDVTPAP